MNSKIHLLRQMLRDVKEQQRATIVVPSETPLDALLPDRGFVRGTLVEWFEKSPGSGVGILALRAARAACREGGAVVVIDRDRCFYPPAAACHFDLRHALIVQPTNDKDEHWALDQALRCPDVAAVLAWPRRLDGHTFRRLQLATEQSGCLGLLIRPDAARREPSWASLRLLISGVGTSSDSPPASWRLRIELLRCRGRFDQHAIMLEIDHQTGEIRDAHPCSLAAQLAHPAIAVHQARA